MFKRLQQHWKVNSKDLTLILFTFALTGSATAYVSRKISEWLFLDKYSFSWWTSKLIVIFFGYQVLILIIGFCFGQFKFFWTYEKKILRRFGLMKKDKASSFYRIAIFASGTGTNAQKIIEHFKGSSLAKIALIVCNNSLAPVLQIAGKENIPSLLVKKNKFYEDGYLEEIKKYDIDLLVLAGFLWKIPPALIRNFPNKIINIHPALLPHYGGKGMYGSNVHEAVIAGKEKQSGITIHYVDDIYDNGKIIFQTGCAVDETDTPESLAKKIHALEHSHYPTVIERIISS